jgi:hypothetical protein
LAFQPRVGAKRQPWDQKIKWERNAESVAVYSGSTLSALKKVMDLIPRVVAAAPTLGWN